jgi:hypothetical protein
MLVAWQRGKGKRANSVGVAVPAFQVHFRQNGRANGQNKPGKDNHENESSPQHSFAFLSHHLHSPWLAAAWQEYQKKMRSG